MKYRVGGGGTVGGFVRVGEAVRRAPPELREWLDAKLEQVGVDPSPTYARYVLGLLLQPEGVEEDAREEEDLEKSSDKVRRRRSRQGKCLLETAIRCSWHNECPDTNLKDGKVTTSQLDKSRKRSRASTGRYHGVFGDGESRKRTAAIDCLMSASDQKVGIEKLVDELCLKLKHIQNEVIDGSTFHFESSQGSEGPRQNTSPEDQAEKYYAAFPPLRKLEDRSAKISMTQSFDNACAWNNRELLCVGLNKKNEDGPLNEGMNDFRVGCNKENVNKKKKGRVFSDNGIWGILGHGSHQKGNIVGVRRHQRHLKAQQSKFCKEFEKEDGSSCKTDPVRMVLMMALASSSKMRSGSTQRYSLGESEFDEPIECDKHYVRQRLEEEVRKNSWAGDNPLKYTIDCESDEECLASLFAKFDHRMEALWELEPKNVSPTSLSLLANTPPDQKTKAVSSNTPPNCSFILSGTNITSSIWSHCPMNNYMPLQSSCSPNPIGREAIVGDICNSSRIVGNELKSVSVKTGFVSPECENFRIVWEELTDSLPPQFIGLEMVGESEASLKTTDAEDVGILLSPKVCYHTIKKESLEALNHSSEKSSFTEVTPHICGLNCHSCVNSVESSEAQCLPPVRSLSSSIESTKLNLEVDEVEEEDLLTSARTHFLPIRSMDSSLGMSQSRYSSGGGVNYEDGTMFSIQSTMEKVTFYRSDSGHLILEEEPGKNEDGSDQVICKTPKKYMVYKGGAFGGLKGLPDQDESGFLPKFLVRQNEKSCQTEEEHVVKVGGDPTSCYVKIREEEIGEEFFFPGDALLANALDSMDQEEIECVEIKLEAPVPSSKSIDEEKVCADPWSRFPSVICSCSALSVAQNAPDDLWDQKHCNRHCWNKIWKPSPDVPHCVLHEVFPNSQTANDSMGELQSRLLRQELYEESEQLFADLHMVHQMHVGVEWIGQGEDPTDCLDDERMECRDATQSHHRKRNLLGRESFAETSPEGTSDSTNNKSKKVSNLCCLPCGPLEEVYDPLEQMDRLLATAVPKVTSKGMLFSIGAEWKRDESKINPNAPEPLQNEYKRRRRSTVRCVSGCDQLEGCRFLVPRPAHLSHSRGSWWSERKAHNCPHYERLPLRDVSSIRPITL